MKAKAIAGAALLFLTAISFTVHSAEVDEIMYGSGLLGGSEANVAVWAKARGYTVNDTNRGASGCRSGKRYVELVKGNLKVYALYFQPFYQEHSPFKVTHVEFEPASPVSVGQARQWAAQVAPVVGTRPATQKQQIPPGTGACDPANGGIDERYTGDFILEYHYAPGKNAVERVKVSNEGIREKWPY